MYLHCLPVKSLTKVTLKILNVTQRVIKLILDGMFGNFLLPFERFESQLSLFIRKTRRCRKSETETLGKNHSPNEEMRERKVET